MTIPPFTFNLYALIYAIACTGFMVLVASWLLPHYHAFVTTQTKREAEQDALRKARVDAAFRAGWRRVS